MTIMQDISKVDDPKELHDIGRLFEINQQFEEAIASYAKAVVRDPSSAMSYNNLGNCYNAIGEFDLAHESWRKAIELDEIVAFFYRNVTQSTPFNSGEYHFRILEKQIQAIDNYSMKDRSALLFAYGQSLMHQGEKELGFKELQKANLLYRDCIQYYEHDVFIGWDNLKTNFTKELIAEKRNNGNMTPAPIFIVGMPRSGSTLVEQILASHPDVYGAGERTDFKDTLDICASIGVSINNLNDITKTQMQLMGIEYINRIKRVWKNNSKRFVDKQLFNFMNVGLIHLALPNAKIIHVSREPVTNCMSIYTRWFNDVPFSYDLGELGRYYKGYEGLMEHWRTVVPDVMLELSYEDLVNDFNNQTRRILDYCGLEWHNDCLNFHQTKRHVITASAAQVKKPLYKSSLTVWQPDAETLKPLTDELK